MPFKANKLAKKLFTGFKKQGGINEHSTYKKLYTGKY